jgi:hypothetical protein
MNKKWYYLNGDVLSGIRTIKIQSNSLDYEYRAPFHITKGGNVKAFSYNIVHPNHNDPDGVYNDLKASWPAELVLALHEIRIII